MIIQLHLILAEKLFDISILVVFQINILMIVMKIFETILDCIFGTICIIHYYWVINLIERMFVNIEIWIEILECKIFLLRVIIFK